MGPQSFDEIDELYARMVKIFEGNPSESDMLFLKDEQKVKALLVLKDDGLWNNEGTLRDSYNLVDETEYYRVFVAEE